MSSGFADICSLLGVWLGGRKARASAAAPSTTGGAGRLLGRSALPHDDPNVRYAFQDQDLEDLFRREIEGALRDAADGDRVTPPPRDSSAPTPFIPATDADIAAALDTLFRRPTLAALDAARAAAARAAAAQAVRLAESWLVEDAARAARAKAAAAQAEFDREEEEAVIALLLAS